MPASSLIRLPDGRVHFPDGQQFQQLGENLGPVLAGERQRHLRHKQAVTGADIVAAVAGFLESQVLLHAASWARTGERATPPSVAAAARASSSITVGVRTWIPKKHR